MFSWRGLALTSFSLLAFTANSILCRLALREATIDPASFTTIRLSSGTLTLLLLAFYHQTRSKSHQVVVNIRGDWLSAFALLVYAFGFSFAYSGLAAGAGALLLFAAVQGTMILAGIRQGELLHVRQWVGLLSAFSGIFILFLPSLSTPPLVASLLMVAAGIGWGVYSLRGRGVANPILISTGNFMRTTLVSIVLSGLGFSWASFDLQGVLYAVASGTIASGLGYAAWYASLRYLTAVKAAAVQLLVPVLTSIAGVLFLKEQVTLPLLIATVGVLLGVRLAMYDPTE